MPFAPPSSTRSENVPHGAPASRGSVYSSLSSRTLLKHGVTYVSCSHRYRCRSYTRVSIDCKDAAPPSADVATDLWSSCLHGAQLRICGYERDAATSDGFLARLASLSCMATQISSSMTPLHLTCAGEPSTARQSSGSLGCSA